MEITAEHFEKATGHKPEQDDLQRSNCKQAGTVGHFHCGWSVRWNHPMFMLTHRQIEAERHVLATAH